VRDAIAIRAQTQARNLEHLGIDGRKNVPLWQQIEPDAAIILLDIAEIQSDHCMRGMGCKRVETGSCEFSGIL
jgi:hypothetical protein